MGRLIAVTLAVALVQAGTVAAVLAGPAGAVSHAAVGRPVRTALRPALWRDSTTSDNWSGYAAEAAAKFTEVRGSWVEPAATCTGKTRYASFWIGIDGYSSGTVEQLGTDADCRGSSPSYYGWWEMYPAASVSLPDSKYPVKPGDTLTAEVSVSSGTFTLTMTSSEGWTFSINKNAGKAVEQESAEWIVEAPEVGSRLAKLNDFGTVRFSACTAATAGGSDEPVSDFTAEGGPHAITMTTNSGITKASPSALGTGGNAFSVTWHHP